MRAKCSTALLLIAGAWIVNFTLLSLSPGDISSRFWGPEVDAAFLQEMRAEKGLHLSYWQQLANWSGRLLQGDFGYSWLHHRPVIDIFRETLPATMQLALFALLIQFVAGGALGLLSSAWQGRKTGLLLDVTSLALYALPSFWLALLCLYLFSLKLEWLPVSGMQSLFSENWSTGAQLLDRLRHILLPGIILGLAGAITSMRYVKARVGEQIHKPYILMARAKGLPGRIIFRRHLLRLALLPMVTQFGMSFPALLSGTLIIEVVFAWPGMGRLTYEALLAKDYPVILAVNFFAAVLVVSGNLIADALYRMIDPRVRL